MFGLRPSRILINPREYQDIPSAANRQRPPSKGANIINPLYASTKDPISIPPLSLYHPDGTINNVNHYYYYHHLSHLDRANRSRKDVHDEDDVEIHLSKRIMAVNLETIIEFGRAGITTGSGWAGSISNRAMRPAGKKTRIEPSTLAQSAPSAADILDPKRTRAREVPAKADGRRHFSFNWRLLLPRNRRYTKDSSVPIPDASGSDPTQTDAEDASDGPASMTTEAIAQFLDDSTPLFSIDTPRYQQITRPSSNDTPTSDYLPVLEIPVSPRRALSEFGTAELFTGNC